MYRDATVAVVVPAYNEADHVGGVVETLPSFVDRAYVVDDCSTDDTWSVVSEHADLRREGGIADPPEPTVTAAQSGGAAPSSDAEWPRVVAVRHRENRGVGGAIKTGYRLALADGMDATVVMAGDGQMDPDHLDRILDPVVAGRAEYAKGTRFSGPEHRSGMSRWRRFGSWLLTGLTRVSTGYWDVEDTQNGYTAISGSALSRIRIRELYEGYGFLNDLLAELSRVNARVVEVPHPARYGDERSEIRYRTFVPALSTLLLANFVARLRRTGAARPLDPAVVGYVLGGVGTVVACLAAVAVLVGAAAGVRISPVWTVPTALAVGGVCAAAGLAADARLGTRSANRPRGTGDPDGGDGT